jgi:DNA-binding NtrC family response regulator
MSDPLISVLVADDDEDQLVLINAILQGAAGVRHQTTLVPDGRRALGALREQVFDVALLDLSMPGLDGLEVMEAIAGDPARPQVIFVSGRGTVATATKAMKLGAYDFVEKPVDGPHLLRLVWKAWEARKVLAKSERLGEVVRRDVQHVAIVSHDPGMQELLGLAARVADSGVSVLVTGESGTGKELVARELHSLSRRADEPMVALNCAAVSESLAESELFGHEKGAFTGAANRKLGLIELADGGTLFLDEIGDLDLALQAKLLRALETKLFRRVGGVKELPANFRLVSATNRPLEQLVEKEQFREDLLYRINAIVLELPPLREREGDTRILAEHFLEEFSAPGGPSSIASDAMAMIEAYHWPGNVRELRNVMERAALLAQGNAIRASDLGALVPSGSPTKVTVGGRSDGLPSLDLGTLEQIAIQEALNRAEWHQGRAAEVLGVSVRTLHRKIKAYGMRRPD